MKSILVLVLATTLAACASIDRTASVNQPLGTALLVGVGDLVLRIERERSLENVVGKADIFGRKTKEGFTEVRFGGMEPNGEVVLVRKDVQILTNETTMSRTPFATTSGSATTSVSGTANTYGGSTQIQGTGTTRYSSTTVLPQEDFHMVIPSDSVAIRLAPNERNVPVSGYIIEILSVSRNSIEYRVLKPD